MSEYLTATVASLGARVLLYPTVAVNVLRNRVQSDYRYWNDITEHIVLGAVPFASDIPTFKEMGVRAVVTLNEPFEVFVPSGLYKDNGIDHLHLPTVDFMFAPSEESLLEGVRFIDRYVSRGERVYIHCKAGRGRSTTLLICYLAEYCGLTPEAAVEMVRAKRPQIQLAEAQWRACCDFHRKRGGGAGGAGGAGEGAGGGEDGGGSMPPNPAPAGESDGEAGSEASGAADAGGGEAGEEPPVPAAGGGGGANPAAPASWVSAGAGAAYAGAAYVGGGLAWAIGWGSTPASPGPEAAEAEKEEEAGCAGAGEEEEAGGAGAEKEAGGARAEEEEEGGGAGAEEEAGGAGAGAEAGGGEAAAEAADGEAGGGVEAEEGGGEGAGKVGGR